MKRPEPCGREAFAAAARTARSAACRLDSRNAPAHADNASTAPRLPSPIPKSPGAVFDCVHGSGGQAPVPFHLTRTRLSSLSSFHLPVPSAPGRNSRTSPPPGSLSRRLVSFGTFGGGSVRTRRDARCPSSRLLHTSQNRSLLHGFETTCRISWPPEDRRRQTLSVKPGDLATSALGQRLSRCNRETSQQRQVGNDVCCRLRLARTSERLASILVASRRLAEYNPQRAESCSACDSSPTRKGGDPSDHLP
jgi:hypothetical protein